MNGFLDLRQERFECHSIVGWDMGWGPNFRYFCKYRDAVYLWIYSALFPFPLWVPYLPTSGKRQHFVSYPLFLLHRFFCFLFDARAFELVKRDCAFICHESAYFGTFWSITRFSQLFIFHFIIGDTKLLFGNLFVFCLPVPRSPSKKGEDDRYLRWLGGFFEPWGGIVERRERKRRWDMGNRWKDPSLYTLVMCQGWFWARLASEELIR